MSAKKRVKLVSTLGPAVEIRGGKRYTDESYSFKDPVDREPTIRMMTSLIMEGANVFRFNFSHGDHEEQGIRMGLVREAEKAAGQKVGFLLDTKGPEIRTEVFASGEKEFSYVSGEKIRIITQQGVKSTRDKIALNVAGGIDIYDYVNIGQTILIDDGKLGLTLVEKDAVTREFIAQVQNNDKIAKQKGVNIPNTKIPFPSLADRDNGDIRFGLDQGLNFIAISFVRTAKDVEAVRNILKDTKNEHVQLISKIENQEGLDNIDEIISASDGIMVARGDMGIEVPLELVPVYQKEIIRKTNEAGKFVITATNMLETMTERPRPTRAETSDVFNSVIDGTDATMLSGESANGAYPVESVRTMSTITKTAQGLYSRYGRLHPEEFAKTSITENLASSVYNATKNFDIKVIVATTESGYTARQISKYRPNADILAITFDEKVEKSLLINWGVIPVLAEKPANTDEMFKQAEELVVKHGLAKTGDNIIVVAGVPVGVKGRTNTMRIITVS